MINCLRKDYYTEELYNHDTATVTKFVAWLITAIFNSTKCSEDQTVHRVYRQFCLQGQIMEGYTVKSSTGGWQSTVVTCDAALFGLRSES